MIKRIIAICVLLITLFSFVSCDNLEDSESESVYCEPQSFDVIFNCPEDDSVNGKVVSVQWNKRYVFPQPSREHYMFNGWSDNSQEYGQIGVWPLADGAELSAVWVPIEYRIDYKLSPLYEDGYSEYSIESETFKLPVPTKANGYMFDGWTGEGISQPTKVVSIPKGTYGNLKYTANWTKSMDIDNQIDGFVIKIVDDHAVVVGYCGDFVETATVPKEYNGFPVTEIGYAAFFGLGKFVENLIIPYSVLTIDEYAFDGCSGTGLKIFITGGEFNDWKNNVVIGANNGTLGNW